MAPVFKNAGEMSMAKNYRTVSLLSEVSKNLKILGLLIKHDLSHDLSTAFDSVWHAGPLHKLKSYGISGQVFGHVLSFLE